MGHHAAVQAADGVPVTVFVSVRTNRHDPDWLKRFAEGVTKLLEVMEACRMSGDIDYLLKIVCPETKTG